MCEVISSVIVGAVVGGSASKLPWRRPLRVVLREGMRAQRKLAQFGASIRAEANQLVAEAREELDHDRKTAN
jgi:hypothetical protein